MSDNINGAGRDWGKLAEIARYAIGSKEAQSHGTIKGGEGRIGMIDGHVIKFNTHASERLRGPKAGEAMFDSCNALRMELYQIARNLTNGAEGSADALTSIRKKLGLNVDGGVIKATKLLDRKTVASVINLIDETTGKDVWTSLRVEDIRDNVASTKRDAETGKMKKVDMRFASVVQRMREDLEPVGQRDGDRVQDEGGQDSGEIVILNEREREGLAESRARSNEEEAEQSVESRVEEPPRAPMPVKSDEVPADGESEGRVADDQVVKEPVDGDPKVENQEVTIVREDVKAEVKDAFNSMNKTNLGGDSVETWFGRIVTDDCFRGLRAAQASLTDEQADEIIKEQVSGGTRFGSVLKTTREKGGDVLRKASEALRDYVNGRYGSVCQSLSKAVERYFAFADVAGSLGCAAESDAVEVCKSLLSCKIIGSIPILMLSQAVSSVGHNLKLELKDAKKVIGFLVNATTDLGLVLNTIKGSSKPDKVKTANTLSKFREAAHADVQKLLWNAILDYVGIDPAQSGSDRGAPGEAEREAGVNQGARDDKWDALIENLRDPDFGFLGDDANSDIGYIAALKSGVSAICEKIGSMKLTGEIARKIIYEQTLDGKTTKFGRILNAAKLVKIVGKATDFRTLLIERLEEMECDEGTNMDLLKKALIDEINRRPEDD